jgi:hypothetical protein
LHVCAFLPTIPLGVSTVPSSTRQMPEWILRPWPRVRFQFESKETHMEQHKENIMPTIFTFHYNNNEGPFFFETSILKYLIICITHLIFYYATCEYIKTNLLHHDVI